jgi:hypothetical protein
MLPNDKASLPKCLYLDQNKWIDLGRAHYGRSDGDDFVKALSAVREAVRKGTLIIPISGVHVMETMAPKDEDRRRRLAEFIVELSGNTAILPHFSLRGLEIIHAVDRKLGREPITAIRTGILRNGLSFALGAEADISAPAGIRDHLRDFVNSPETSIRLLVEAGDRSLIESVRAQDEAILPQLEETRTRVLAELTDDMRHRVELADLFTKGDPAREMVIAIRQLGSTPSSFAKRFASPEEWMAFFHSVPSVDVFVTLGLARDKDANRRIHRNDLKDMAFLSVAVPYANIVVAENFWAGVVHRTGLDKRYDTIIETDARKLPEILADCGCL